MSTEARMTGDQYMELLEQRRAAYMAANPPRQIAEAAIERIKREFPHANPQLKPKWQPLEALLEWFIQPGDEDLVELPEKKPAPKRQPKPRVYRSAASLREERDRLVARRVAIIAIDADGDMASTNLSPLSRSRAARNAGRRRFAQLDRDLERVANLNRRIRSLDFRINTAEAREKRAALSSTEKGNHQ